MRPATIKSPLLGLLAGLVVFVLVLFLLARQLHGVHLHQVLAAAQALPAGVLLQALALTLLSYLLLTCYDILALRHLGRRLPYPQVALTALTAYALSHNFGLAPLIGGSIRYRLYSADGLASTEIAGVVALTLLSFSLGVILLSAVALLAEPQNLAALLHLPATALRIVGAALGLLLLAYLLWTYSRRAPLRWRQ